MPPCPSTTTYCSFLDADLTLEQVGLYSRGWLIDRNINFCLRRLEARLSLSERILLLDPSVASFLRVQLDVDDVEEVLDAKHGLAFSRREWIIVPINDADDRVSRGSHWSLLVFNIKSNDALHLDSSRSRSNTSSAVAMAAILSSLSSRAPGQVTNVDAPTQSDGFSCGVYTCLFAEFWATRLGREDTAFDPILGDHRTDWLADLRAEVDDARVARWRLEMVQDVEAVVAEKLLLF